MVESNPALKQYTYVRHKPEETVLYKIIQNNWLTFKNQIENDSGYPLPDFVVKEFDEYLRCGILAHGFLRAQCQSCQFEHLIAFSRLRFTDATYQAVGLKFPIPDQAVPGGKAKDHG